MGFLRIFALSALSLLFTLALSFAIASFSIQALFYPDLYIKVLEDNQVYDSLWEQAKQNNLDEEFSKGDVESEINRLLGNGLAYIRSDTDNLDLSIRLGSFQDVDLADTFDKNRDIDKIRLAVDIFNKATYASIVLVFLMPLLIAKIAKDSIRSLIKRIGMTLVTIGAINVAFAYFGKIGIGELLSRLPVVELPVSVQPVVLGIVLPIFDNLIFYSGIVLVIGVVLVAFSFLKKENKK